MTAIDKDLVARRFRRSRESYDDHAVVQRKMARRLAEALPERSFPRALEFGCGTGIFTRFLRPCCERLFRNDLAGEGDSDFRAGDIEFLDLPGELDLIASNAVWQWLERPVQMVAKMAAALRDDGVVAISSFAPGTFLEISELIGISLWYMEPAAFRDLFEKDFEILHFETYEEKLSFHDPMKVLHHLRHTGVTGVSAGFKWTRTKIDAFCREYHSRFPDVTLTYRPILLIGKKKNQGNV